MNVDSLEGFLSAQNAGADVRVTGYQRLDGGFSTDMSQFTAHIDGEPHLLVRRSELATGKAVAVSDRHVEWAITRHLTDVGKPWLPHARWFDPDGSALGTPSIITDYVADAETLGACVMAGDESRRSDLTDSLCDLVAAVHMTDVAQLPPAIERPASWSTYIDDLVEIWRRTERQHVERNPFLRYVATWLDNNRPPEAALTLVHGDMQPPNVLVAPGGLVAIDWEFPHIGDPREDLGWLKMIEGMNPIPIYSRDEEGFCQRYRAMTGMSEEVINPSTVAYFSVLAVMRVYSQVYEQVAAMSRGENNSLPVAYMSAVAITKTHADWHEIVIALSRGLEAGRIS